MNDELNREQIVKTLECCSKQYKDDTSDECPDCIYRNLGCDCVLQAITDAISLIKELAKDKDEWLLTAELNLERIRELEETITELNKENERLMREKTALECIASTARNQAKAETVRKMQERLKKELRSGNAIMDKSIADIVDQIAKEMLEDKDE